MGNPDKNCSSSGTGKWLLKKSIWGKESAHTVSLSQLSYPAGQKWSDCWTILVSQGESSSCWPWKSFGVMTGLLPSTWHPLYSRCHWLSIQVDLHLYPYFSCSLSIDWVTSCACEPVEKDTSNSLCRIYWLVLLKPKMVQGEVCPNIDKFKCLCISLHQCLEQVCVNWSMFTDVLCHLLVNIREVTEGEHPAFVTRQKLFLILPLLSPPSDLAAFINVCSVQMSHHVPDIDGWSKGQHSSHWQVNVLTCPC